MAEDKQIDLLKSLIENKEKIEKDIEEAKKRIIPTVNIINILGCAYDEVKNSSLLHNIFKIKFKYENKEINFAKDFSEYIIKEKLKNDSVNINSTAEAYNEFYASSETWRRIDLFIHSDNFEIIIENKIWADDQPNQLKDYYNNRINENKNNDKIKDNIFIVYLTRNRDKPKEISIDRELIEELENKNKICYLSHDDIAEWIKNSILNKYQFLKEEKLQLIYSALIQIRDNEKTITNPNEENNMEKKEIKRFFEENKYFETLLNKDETIKDSFDKLNKFYELLENAQRVIIDKKFELISGNIKYSSKVSEFIKKVQSDKGEDYMKGALLYNEEGIKGQFNGIWSRNILISIIGYLDLCITLEQNIYIVDYHLFINIIANNNIANKLREEPIKTEIGKILGKDSNKYKEDEDRGYIYTLYIDIEKDKPEEIGQKIIDLYNLLKEKITQ